MGLDRQGLSVRTHQCTALYQTHSAPITDVTGFQSSTCCGHAVDPEDKNVTEDEWALPRAKELAQMVFGEDLEEAAGDTLDRNFLHLSSSAHCGKMAALEHLLQLWSSAGNNKVHSPVFDVPSGFQRVWSLALTHRVARKAGMI